VVQEISEKIELPNGDQIGHHVRSQFLSTPRSTHLQVVMRILRYLKKALGRGLLYSDHRHTRVVGVKIVIGLLVIELLGFYHIDSYPSFLLYIYSLFNYQFFLRVSVYLHGIRVRETLTLKFTISKFTFLKIFPSSPPKICKKNYCSREQ